MTEVIRKGAVCSLAQNWLKIALNFYNLVVTVCTTRFNIKKVCLLLTQGIYVFRVDLITKSDCLHIIN